MSTTDTRAAFEAWHRGAHGYFIEDLSVHSEGEQAKRWEAWQAATEAAKATGTAPVILMRGEGAIDERIKTLMAEIGMPNSSSLYAAMKQLQNEIEQGVELDWTAEAARSMAVSQADYNHDMDELSQDFEPVGLMDLQQARRHIVGLRKRLRNAKAKAEAARQPTSALPVKRWEDRMENGAYITGSTSLKSAITGNLGREMARDGEIAELRAALAATAAPVLSDEQINDLWNSLPGIAIHNKAYAQGMSTDYALRIAFARAILAATTAYRR